MTEKFESLIRKALKNENLNQYEIKFRGGTEKGEGYIGDIAFVDVHGKREGEDNEVVYSLVLKTGGKGRTLRSIVRLGFEREIHIYSKIIPSFWALQQEQELQKFSSIPRCYLTILTDDDEALVLENLKSSGFKLYDRTKVMTLNHINLVLGVLGQWHALSFALQKKKPFEFEQLTSNWKCPVTKIFVNSHVGRWMNMAQKHLIGLMQKVGEEKLLRSYQQKTENKLATDILNEILSKDIQQVVVTHGDCWNNNLMFKYQDKEELIPSEVKMLDFQISSISSPVLDLSYFIYAVSSEEQLQHFDEFLQTYYNSLHVTLQQLHCNSQELFPYHDLLDHWRQYSAYGAMINPLIVCDNLVDKDDAVSYSNKDLKYESIIQSVDQKQNELFSARLMAVARHFVSYSE